MNAKQKIVSCALAASFVLLLVIGYGLLVLFGKADVGPLLALIGSLITVAVTQVSNIIGHVSAMNALGAANVSALVSAIPGALPASPTAEAAAAGTPLAPSPVTQ